MSTTLYLENQTPVASCGFITPCELWYGKPPTYHLRVFGCLTYVHIGRERRSGKFADTAKQGIFLGYQEGHHKYRVWLPDEQRVIYSHNIVFNKLCFPWKESHPLTKRSVQADNLSDFLSSTPKLTTQGDYHHVSEAKNSLSDPAEPSSVTPGSIFPSGIVKGDQESNSAIDIVSSSNSAIDNSSSSPIAAPSPHPRAIHNISSKIDPAKILPTCTRRHATTATALQTAVLSNSDPVTYNQAISQSELDNWIASMNKEISDLEAMNVWEEFPLPPGQHALGTKWVYKSKTGLTGELLIYKFRLCAQGFSQIEGLDYLETYAPTGRLSTLQTALGIGATENLEIVHLSQRDTLHYC